MTAVTIVGAHNNSATPEVPLMIDEITVTSDYTYTPTAMEGKEIRVISCYNNTDGASVVVTLSEGVLTLGAGQTLSAENVILTYTYMDV